MKFSEIKKNIESGNMFADCGLEIKPYISILLKDAFIKGSDTENIKIDGIIKNCIEDRDGIKYINYMQLEMSKFIMILTLYTNIEDDSDDIYDTYDYLVSQNIWEYIINQIPEQEIEYLEMLINRCVHQEIEIGNSLGNILNRNLNKLISKIPTEKEMSKILNKLPKVLDSISPENKEIFKNLVNINK